MIVRACLNGCKCSCYRTPDWRRAIFEAAISSRSAVPPLQGGIPLWRYRYQQTRVLDPWVRYPWRLLSNPKVVTHYNEIVCNGSYNSTGFNQMGPSGCNAGWPIGPPDRSAAIESVLSGRAANSEISILWSGWPMGPPDLPAAIESISSRTKAVSTCNWPSKPVNCTCTLSLENLWWGQLVSVYLSYFSLWHMCFRNPKPLIALYALLHRGGFSYPPLLINTQTRIRLYLSYRVNINRMWGTNLRQI